MHEDHSKKWVWIAVVVVGGLIVLLAVFRFGMFVGEKQAAFTYHWGENYGRLFGEPRSGFFVGMMGGNGTPLEGGPLRAFGSAGTVLSVASDTIAMRTGDNIEKTVAIGSSTIIRSQDATVGIADLRVGDPIVVIGAPGDNGEIEARFIRIFPAGAEPLLPAGASGTPPLGMIRSR